MNKEKLLNMIKYSYERVPFYMKKQMSDIVEEMTEENVTEKMKNLPIICKDEIVRDGVNISLDYGMENDGSIIMLQTSGSTGKCLNVYWDKTDFNKSLLSLWIYRKKYYGINPGDKMCYFYTIGNTDRYKTNGNIKYEEDKLRIGFSKANLNDENMDWICMKIKEFNPRWLNLQPSIALLLAKAMTRNNIDKIQNLSYIELTGEMLLESTRQKLKEVFKCEIANQYGCHEANSIAFECPHNKLHCMEDNIYVEIVDNEGKEVQDGKDGSIIITTLNNHAMPFIRYKIGDRGVIDHNHAVCKCGNKSPVLKLSSGRVNDYIVLSDGSRINAYIFVRAIETVNIKLDNIILQFRVVQKEYAYFIVYLVLDEDVIDAGIGERDVENLFLKSIAEERLYDTEFDFEYYDEFLPDEDNGKLRYFVREV